MSAYFAYQDAHGFIYPAHPVLLRKPGLIPGQYDPVSQVFTPTGNPLRQTGNIIEDVALDGKVTVLSGLTEDKGAQTAPAKGVVFSRSEPLEAENLSEEAEFGKRGRKVIKD